MPATVTHAFFAIDVYQNLRKGDKLLVNKEFNRLKMFGQSTDSMMFYNIESLKKGKKLRQFQNFFHTNYSQKFFVKLCKTIKLQNLQNDQDVLAFLYGFICHYVLDSIVHPFVVYKTGVMDKNDKTTFKYNNLHSYMETYIDNYMILQKTNHKPYNFRLDKFCFDTRCFSNSLNNVIDVVFDDVFNIKNMSKIYYKSLKQMKSFLRKYRYDRFGIKKIGYRGIDLFTSKSFFKFDVLSYHYFPDNKKYFLNTNHNIWYNPINHNISSNDSFDDLYKKSIKEAVYIIKCVNDYFNDKNIVLEEVFTNKSYLSGLDCNVPLNYKKFEF